MTLVNAPGGVGSIAAAVAIAAAETVAASRKVPANSLQVGTTFELIAFGTISATANGTILGRVRAGAAGTTADTQAAATPAIGAVTAAVGFHAEGIFTVRSIGAAGTAVGNLEIGVGANTNNRSAQTATIAINTTVDNFVTLTFIGGGSAPSITVVNAVIAVIEP